MYGFGSGSDFVAYLEEALCTHCNNVSRQALYAGYSSQMFMLVTEYTYNSLALICTVCEHGARLEFDPLQSKLRVVVDRERRRKRQQLARQWVNSLLPHVEREATVRFYDSLGRSSKRRYRNMIRQLEMDDFFVQLIHNRPSSQDAE